MEWMFQQPLPHWLSPPSPPAPQPQALTVASLPSPPSPPSPPHRSPSAIPLVPHAVSPPTPSSQCPSPPPSPEIRPAHVPTPPLASRKAGKRKAGDSLFDSGSVVPCVCEPPAKKAKVEGGRPRGRPPTRDVIKYTCTIFDPANSPHSSSLPCSSAVFLVHVSYARLVMCWPRGARTRHSRPCRFSRTPQPPPRRRLCGQRGNNAVA